MKSRKVIRGILNHCYQRTVLGFVLFYNVFDCLVYFTLFCTIIKKFDIKAVALTLMPDHIHNSSVAADLTKTCSTPCTAALDRGEQLA